MPRVSTVEKENAPEDVLRVYKQMESYFGRVSALPKVMAHNPAFLKSLFELYGSIHSENDELMQKIAVKVSKINSCKFCEGAHSYLLRKMGVSDEKIRSLEDDSQHSEKERAALRWAEVVTNKEYFGPDADRSFEELKKQFDEKEIVNITAVIGMYNFLNRFVDSLGIDPEF
ncbi:MAG: carboxymuconolactone decarboxylase family protein [Thaumarchaeota archaeon]|nr:carboxymuconolactone decarboxylase family protein [Nitrososphaerota archaeon]